MKYCENWGQVGFLIDLIFLLKKKTLGHASARRDVCCLMHLLLIFQCSYVS